MVTRMPSQSIVGKCVQKIYLRNDGNETFVLPTSLLGVQEVGENNNVQQRDELCVLTAEEINNGEQVFIEDTTLVLPDGKSLHISNLNDKEGENVCFVQLHVEDTQQGGITASDEELTSLSWLQNTNLLQSINFNAGSSSMCRKTWNPVPSISVKSEPISNTNTEESETESSWDGSNLSYSDALLPKKVPCEDMTTLDAKKSFSKPPHSFSTLIFLAIESSTHKALPVRDIYLWITQHFPYYRFAPNGWKNSVRHNLSLNKCFCKVERGPTIGKGSLWMVDPVHRPQLIQSLCKIPHIKADVVQQLISENIKQEVKKEPVKRKVNSTTNTTAVTQTSVRSNLPDPDLFPYLSRRLADNIYTEDKQDVDAANAMLALGQGHISPNGTLPSEVSSSLMVLVPKKDYDIRKQFQDPSPLTSGTRSKHNGNEPAANSGGSQVSPAEEDHTYSFSPRPVKSRLRSSSITAVRKLHFNASTTESFITNASKIKHNNGHFHNNIVDEPPEAIKELEVRSNDEKPVKRTKIQLSRVKGRGRGRGKCRGKSR